MGIKAFYSTIFFQHFAYGIIIPTLIIWQHQTGLNYIEIGLIQSIGLIVLLTSEIPSSFFADKVSKKITLLLASLFSSISFVFLIQAQNFSFFLISQVFLSLANAFFSGTQESYLHDIVKKNNITNDLAKMSIIDETATIFGILLSSVIIKNLDIKSSFLLGLMSLIACFIITLLLENTKRKVEIKNKKEHFKKMPKTKILAMIIVVSLISFRGEMVFQANFINHQTLLYKLGMIYALSKIFSIVGSCIAHKTEHTFGVSKSLIITTVIQIFSFILLLIGKQTGTIIALCLYMFSENIFRNIKDAWVLDNAPPKLRTTVLSSLSFSSAIFALSLKPIIGFSLDQSVYLAIYLIISIKVLSVFITFKIFNHPNSIVNIR